VTFSVAALDAASFRQFRKAAVGAVIDACSAAKTIEVALNNTITEPLPRRRDQETHDDSFSVELEEVNPLT
jgi:hypothetical protein